MQFSMRRFAASAVLVAASFTTAFTVGTIAAPPASASVAVSPAQEAAACAAVYHYHHVNALGWMDGTWPEQGEWQRAWHRAWHLAAVADPDLGHAIRRYLFADTGWSLVPYLCGSGL